MKTLKLIGLYWQHKDSKQSWLILLLIISLNLLSIYFMVLMAKWNGLFFNALSAVDAIAFKQSLQMFIGLMGISVIIAMYQQYFNQMIYIRWRKWLTAYFSEQWLDNTRYYQLHLQQSTPDNPDQRLAEDIHYFTFDTLELSLGFIHALLTLASFISMLWILSSNFTLHIFGLSISHYMVWIALAYAFFGSILSHYIGRYLARLHYQQQQYEADFRYQLVQIRDHAENIALRRQADWQRQKLSYQFQHLWQNWAKIMVYDKRLTGFSSAYQRLSLVIPHLAAAPQYFIGKLSIGDLMQTASAFAYVQQALSWFIESYAKLTAWKATVKRLLEFQQSLNHCPLPKNFQVSLNQDWQCDKLTAYLPDQSILFELNHLKFQNQKIYHIKGANAVGKTILMQILAGIWFHFEGNISKPSGKIIFLSDKPYLPPMSLYDFFNLNKADVDLNQIKAALSLFDLKIALNDPKKIQNWSTIYSNGQIQALMLVQACLLKPDWLMLDEAFNAIAMNPDKILQHLKQLVPEMGICFISHQMVIEFTDNIIEIK